MADAGMFMRFPAALGTRLMTIQRSFAEAIAQGGGTASDERR
jgi:hypothetical protein